MVVAQLLELIEEEAREEPDADAELQDEDVVLQLACLLGFDEVGEEDLGGVAGQFATVVNNVRDRRGIGDERLVATLLEVLLAQLPFEAVGERHEILDDAAARLGI